jgi:hypothetical protein
VSESSSAGPSSPAQRTRGATRLAAKTAHRAPDLVASATEGRRCRLTGVFGFPRIRRLASSIIAGSPWRGKQVVGSVCFIVFTSGVASLICAWSNHERREHRWASAYER